MRWNTFGRSAAFAALAGVGVVPWLATAGPLLGMQRALALYLLALTAVYVAGCAPSLERGLSAGLLSAGLGACVAAATRTLPELAFGHGIVLAVSRGGVLYRQRSARTLAVEIALVGGGLLFARFLAAPGPVSMALAIWGFLLVQSVFFLVGGVRTRDGTPPRQDPFDAAHARASALLDELAV